MPLQFSFIIPFYNRATFLQKSIKSIYLQGLDEHLFEVILINDGSTDNSLTIANEFTEKKSNVKVFTQKNSGPGASRNIGLNVALGKYIHFLDSDDWLEPNSFSKLLNIAEDLNLEILEFAATIVLTDGNKFLRAMELPKNVTDGISYGRLLNMDSSCNKIYLNTFLKEHNLKFSNETYGEDLEFITRTYFFAKRVFAINNSCINFYQTENSLTRTKGGILNPQLIDGLYKTLIHLNNFKKSIPDANYKELHYLDVRLNEIVFNIIFQSIKRVKHRNAVFIIVKKLKSDNLYFTNKPLRDFKKTIFRNIVIKSNIILKVFISLTRSFFTNKK